MIKVGIVDDHLLIIKGIEEMISHMDSCALVVSFTSIRDARIGLSLTDCNVLLLDINLPDGDGIEYCRELKKTHPELKILGLSTYHQPLLVKNMIRNGASGFLLKTISLQELKSAIEKVGEGELYIQKELKESLILDSVGKSLHSGFDGNALTRREKEILGLIAEGHTSRQIADKLFIALKTVETHRSHIMDKLQVNNTAGLIRTAMEKGLLS